MACTISGTVVRGDNAASPTPLQGVVVSLRPVTGTLFVAGHEVVGPWPEVTTGSDGTWLLSAYRADETDPPIDWTLSFSTGLALSGLIPNQDTVPGGAAELKDSHDWVPIQDTSTGPVTVLAGPRGLKGDPGTFTNETAAETYPVTGSGSFANAIAALAAAGETASLVLSDEHVIGDSLTVPSNVTLRYTGKGRLTVTDNPTSTTLACNWTTATTALISGTTAVPVTAVPVTSTAGMAPNDTAILFAIDGNGATTPIVVTIATVDSGTQFSTTSTTSIKQTIASGAVARQGWKTGLTAIKVVSLGTLEVGDEFVIADNGQTVYSSVMSGVYTPDTGECLQISAIDVPTKTVTFSAALSHPHTNEAVTGRRKLLIKGPIVADPAHWCFTANRDGTTGRVEVDAATNERVWVEWFGAVADAAISPTALGTDSTAAIQAAIMASPPHGGVDVWHAGSSYRITAPIKIHQSSKWAFRDSMRIFGRAPQNDQLIAGPTTWVWSGGSSLWTAMMELYSRNCRITGIWFNVAGSAVTPYTLPAAVDVDRANQSVTCTENAFEDCNFGEPTNYANQIMYVGVLAGRRNQANSDFFDFWKCVWFNQQRDGSSTVGTGCGVYVANTTDQHKRHMYHDCNWRGTLVSAGYYGYKSLQYGLYYASGSFTLYECHFYSLQSEWYIGTGTNNIVQIGGDSENCFQLCRDDSIAAGTILIQGTRFSTGGITGDVPSGYEAIKVNTAALTIQGCIFNPGSERSYNEAFKISAGGAVTEIGNEFPNTNPFDLSSPYPLTSLGSRGKVGGSNNGSPAGAVGGLTRALRRRLLQGNYLDGTLSNDGGLWLNSPLAVGSGAGPWKLTPPGPIKILNLPPKATVITTPGGGNSVPASAYLWYTLTRITSSGTERPTGVAVPVLSGATSQVILSPPAAYDPTDTGFNVYRAAGTDLTTVPAATTFRRITSGTTYTLPPSALPLTITDDHGTISGNAVLPNVDVTPPGGAGAIVALSASAAGVSTAGTHVVAISNVTAAGTQTGPLTTGESFVGPLSAPYTVATNEKVHVAGIPTGGGIVSRSIYMSKAGTRFPLYWAGNVADGTTTFDINVADASLTVRGPAAIPAGLYYYTANSKTLAGGSSGIFVNDKSTLTMGLPGLPVLRLPGYLPGSSAYGICRTKQGEAAPNTAANSFELEAVASLPSSATDIATLYVDYSVDDWIISSSPAPAAQTSNSNTFSTAVPAMLSVLSGDVYLAGNLTVAGSLALSSVPGHGATHAPWQSDPIYYDHGNAFQNAIDVLPLGRIYAMHDSLTMTAGALYVLYFTPARSMSITQMIVALSAVFAGQNYLEAALYAVGATDSALTMVRRSGDLSATALSTEAGVGSTVTTNTGMTATGLYSLPLAKDSAGAAAGAYALVRGTRYAVGVVANVATTMGKFAGLLGTTGFGQLAYSTATLGGVANLLYPVFSKQFASAYTAGSPIPTSHGAAAGASNGTLPWSALG